MRAVAGRSCGESRCANRMFGVSDALADPIVQALMAADRIDAGSVTALMQRIAVRLRPRGASTRR